MARDARRARPRRPPRVREEGGPGHDGDVCRGARRGSRVRLDRRPAAGIDAHFFEQHFAPRAARSPWSQRNVEIVERKIAAGEMQPRGLAEVERARADGRWERAYAGSRTAEPHPDFLAALAENPAAESRYAALSAQDRFAIYFRLHALKTPEARARRVAAFIDLLNRGEPIL